MTTTKPQQSAKGPRPPADWTDEAEFMQWALIPLRAAGWHIDTEIAISVLDGNRTIHRPIDAVASRDDELRAIEGKPVTLNEKLLNQCVQLLPHFHRVYSVSKHPGHRPHRSWVQMRQRFRRAGVGVLLLTRDARLELATNGEAVLNPNPDTERVIRALNQPKRPQRAGTAAPMHGERSGRAWERWTSIREYVTANPGCSIALAIGATGLSKRDHNDLVNLAKRGQLEQVAGVRAEGSGKWALYICEEDAA